MYNLLLAMMTKKPRANIAATPNFCFKGIWSLRTMVIGRAMTGFLLDSLHSCLSGGETY